MDLWSINNNCIFFLLRRERQFFHFFCFFLRRIRRTQSVGAVARGHYLIYYEVFIQVMVSLNLFPKCDFDKYLCRIEIFVNNLETIVIVKKIVYIVGIILIFLLHPKNRTFFKRCSAREMRSFVRKT